MYEELIEKLVSGSFSVPGYGAVGTSAGSTGAATAKSTQLSHLLSANPYATDAGACVAPGVPMQTPAGPSKSPRVYPLALGQAVEEFEYLKVGNVNINNCMTSFKVAARVT